MPELPKTLEEAIAQSRAATLAAIADGYHRLQVELLFPELKPTPIAEQFLPALSAYGDKLKILFADAGGAALAVRDWGDVPFKISDIGTGRSATIQTKIAPEDEIFLFVAPTSVEVPQLEKMCEEIGENRPFVLLNPRLEDSGIVGIGYTARQTRQRFINTIESCYYLRPIFEEAAVFRCYPGMWEVWLENDGNYQKIAELPQKPVGDELDAIIAQGNPQTETDAPVKKPSMIRGLQRFIRALRS